jgi:hypothetical protein
MPRPPVRATRKLSEAEEWGKLTAQQKMRVKKHKFTVESFLLSAREHMGKLIDTMTFSDVVDVVAAIGLTTVIHDTVINLESLKKIFSKASFMDLSKFLGSANIVSGFGALIGGMLADFFKQFTQPQPEIPKEEEPQYFTVLSWLLSFSIAWCIVKWGDKLISAGISSVPSIIKLLMSV